jgi:AraC-like DNA-binding protein
MDLEAMGVKVVKISLGEVVIRFNPEEVAIHDIENMLETNGFSRIKDKEGILVEEIRKVVIDLVHHTTFNAMVRNSDYLVGKFGKTYPYLSSVFSKYEGITLEKYIIFQKIEKAKALIEEDELSLSEIAFMMGYSSVQYLSTQFKSVTGVSVSDFKKHPSKYRISIDKIGKDEVMR